MSLWQEYKLSDLLEGKNISFGIGHPGFHTEIDSVPMLRANNIRDGQVKTDDVLRVAAKIESQYKSTRLQGGELLITVVDGVGECAIAPDFLRGWNVAKAVSVARTQSGFDKRYIKYCFKSEEMQYQLDGKPSQPYTSLSSLKSLVLSVPPLREQKIIATVLGSLDDKINLLHRQNKTLEAMAETLYSLWFVEQKQDDWKEVTLDAVASNIVDGVHSSLTAVDVGMPLAAAKDMHTWGINIQSCRKIAQSDFDALVKAECRPMKGDIVIAKDGIDAKHIFVAEKDMDVVVLSSIIILRPNGLFHPLLLTTFLKLESTRASLVGNATTGIALNAGIRDMRKFKLQLPPKRLQEKAIIYIQPLYKKCWENDRQISLLEKIRDNLLTKLMSREVRVDLG